MLTWAEIRCVQCESTKWVLLEKCQVHGYPDCLSYRAAWPIPRPCNGTMVPTGRIQRPRAA